MNRIMEQLGPTVMAAIALGVLVFGLVAFFVVFSFGRTWLQARASGVPIGFIDLVGMFIRKVNSSLIVNSLITTHKAGIRVSRDFLEAHYLAKGNVAVLCQALIMEHQAGIKIPPESLAAHQLAGGNILDVVRGLISASRANIPLSFDQACAIDLAGRDIVKAVNTSVDPRVIDCPTGSSNHTGKVTLDAVAQDGIQLKVKA
ncbi:MAG: flotillin-like FloA family protein, partial [Planctomycetes bacterium]|nr:flotillin-like FloA family protein [Planctomycetota bacterium]